MPHKFYHGKTGRVFNVTPHAVGVVVNKQVRLVFNFKFQYLLINNINFFNSFNRNRIIEKRINVRIEHVKHSNSRLDFLNRVKRIELLKKDAKEKGIRLTLDQLKRQVIFFIKVLFNLCLNSIQFGKIIQN
jgi:large subunit ribosomal protein L21e